MLLIQLLGLRWTKRDRNIEATRLRAAEPTAVSFQTPRLPNVGECWLQDHKVRQLEWADRVSAGMLEVLRLDEKTISVGLAAEHRFMSLDPIGQGKPITLGLGETAQFFVQFRAQYYEEMWFERQVGNVAWLPRFDSEVFRLRPFTYRFEIRSPLAS